MSDFEKLGAFYIGREYDPNADTLSAEPLMYDSRELTTHAVCVGMTGSGKTGLCISLLEEAALDGIPALVVDPKGDIANLMLTFPGLRPPSFGPGSTAVKRRERVFHRMNWPQRPPNPGRGASPNGERTVNASGNSATPWTSRSTHPAARPACRCRYCAPSRLLPLAAIPPEPAIEFRLRCPGSSDWSASPRTR